MRPYRGMTEDGKWVKGWYAEYNGNPVIYPFEKLWMPHPVIPETVGQSTGLKDSKRTEEYPEGKEIYEGYEIYFSQSKSQHYQGYVKWSEKGLCYLVHCHWEKQDEIPNICNGYENKYEFDNTCVKRLTHECFDIEIIHDKEQGNG